MARLRDIAGVIRSKNAGPFYLTLDIMFPTPDSYRRVRDSGVISQAVVARLYKVNEGDVAVIPYDPSSAIKITLPRAVASGDVGDTDVFGAQQHAPLLDLEVPISADR